MLISTYVLIVVISYEYPDYITTFTTIFLQYKKSSKTMLDIIK